MLSWGHCIVRRPEELLLCMEYNSNTKFQQPSSQQCKNLAGISFTGSLLHVCSFSCLFFQLNSLKKKWTKEYQSLKFMALKTNNLGAKSQTICYVFFLKVYWVNMCILFKFKLFLKIGGFFILIFILHNCEKLSRWKMMHKVWKVLCWVSVIPICC